VAKRPSKHGKSWSPTDINELRRLAKESTPARVIGIKLDRTESAVRSKASELKIFLGPALIGRRSEAGPRAAGQEPKLLRSRPSRGTSSTGARAAAKTRPRSAGASAAKKPKGTSSTGPKAKK